MNKLPPFSRLYHLPVKLPHPSSFAVYLQFYFLTRPITVCHLQDTTSFETSYDDHVTSLSLMTSAVMSSRAWRHCDVLKASWQVSQWRQGDVSRSQWRQGDVSRLLWRQGDVSRSLWRQGDVLGHSDVREMFLGQHKYYWNHSMLDSVKVGAPRSRT